MRHEKLLGQIAFFEATQRAMTERSLEPNGKTDFFKSVALSKLFSRKFDLEASLAQDLSGYSEKARADKMQMLSSYNAHP